MVNVSIRNDSVAALNAFKAVRVKHLKLEELLCRLEEVNFPSSLGKIIAVVGAAGVGKSTALEYFYKKFCSSHVEEMNSDPGFVPSVYVTLPTGFKGEFDWKDAYQRLLAEFCEPLIARKVLPRIVVDLDGERVEHVHKLVTSALARSFRNGLMARKTHFVIIDEASSIFITKNERSYKYQFELLKSIVNDWKCPLVLSGAFDLLKIEDFNSQLIRRTKIIHFERYYPHEVMEGQNKYGKAFVDTINTLFAKVPIPVEERLVGQYTYLMQKSLGSTGLLKDWIMRALEMTLQTSDNPQISFELMEKAALPVRQLMKIEKENKQGEQKLQDESEEELAKLMGFSHGFVIDNGKVNIDKKPMGRKPGQRNPSRDPLGRE